MQLSKGDTAYLTGSTEESGTVDSQVPEDQPDSFSLVFRHAVSAGAVAALIQALQIRWASVATSD